MRQPVPTEHWEQVQLFSWAENLPELELMHAIPNGGKRDIRVALKLKEEGVKAGVPDICLPVPRSGKHGLYIELKRRKYGRVSADQLKWLEALSHQGMPACGLYGQQLPEGHVPLIERLKHAKRCDNRPVDGQISMFGGAEDGNA